MTGLLAQALQEAVTFRVPVSWSVNTGTAAIELRANGADPPSAFKLSIRVRRNSITAGIDADRLLNRSVRMRIVTTAQDMEPNGGIGRELSGLCDVIEWTVGEGTRLVKLRVELPEQVTDEQRQSIAVVCVSALAEVIAGAECLQVHVDRVIPSDLEEFAPSDDGFPEGAIRRTVSNRYERNPRNRALALLIHGYRCLACGSDLGEKYGPIARGRIHVHHTVPVSEVGPAYVCDPGRDLVPLCPTCHFVSHLRTPPLTIAELRAALEHGAT